MSKTTRRGIRRNINVIKSVTTGAGVGIRRQSKFLRDVVDTAISPLFTVIQRMDLPEGAYEDWYVSTGGEVIPVISLSSKTAYTHVSYLCRMNNNYSRRKLVVYIYWKPKLHTGYKDVDLSIGITRLNAAKPQNIVDAKYDELPEIGKSMVTSNNSQNKFYHSSIGKNSFVSSQYVARVTNGWDRNEHAIVTLYRNGPSSSDTLRDFAQILNFRINEYG